MSDKINDLMAKYRENPQIFMQEILGFTPWKKQEAIARLVANHARIAVRSCHDSGKTAIAARIALWFMFTRMPAVVITTAPTYRQVSELLWREMRYAYRYSKVPLGGRIYETPQLSLAENWYAIGLSTDDPNRFQGFHSENILLIVDEAPGVTQSIFDAAEGILTSDSAKVLLIGNPTELSGEFYNAFYGTKGVYSTMSISAFDTPNLTEPGIKIDDIRNGEWKKKAPRVAKYPYLVTPRWVSEKYAQWGEESPLWQVKVLGNFPTSVLNTMLTIANIEANLEYRRSHDQTKQDKEERHKFGVDVARFGDDYTTLTHAQGKYLLEEEGYSKQDTMQTANMVAEKVAPYPGCRIVVDSDGVGGGVFDRLNELKNSGLLNAEVIPFRNAAKPSLQNIHKYANARAEAYFTFSSRVRSCDIILKDIDQLVGDLTTLRYTMNSKGRIVVEPKEAIKKRLGRSPDFSDSAVICFYEPLVSGWISYFAEQAEPYTEKTEGTEEPEEENIIDGQSVQLV